MRSLLEILVVGLRAQLSEVLFLKILRVPPCLLKYSFGKIQE